MRTLVIVRGAVGGYFGGRLAQAGRDVTFLVRPRRAALLQANGLSITSPLGDFHLAAPQLATQESLHEPYDLILLSCKAYDLDSAMESFAGAIGPHTAILPLLNGMAHIDALSGSFVRRKGARRPVHDFGDAQRRRRHRASQRTARPDLRRAQRRSFAAHRRSR